MAKQPAERENGSLARRIFRRICREPIHMKRFETDPHGMGRIGQAAVSESVAEQQIAEFVVDSGDGHWQLTQKSKTDTDDYEENSDECQRLALGQARERGFDGVEHSWHHAREKYSKKRKTKGD